MLLIYPPLAKAGEPPAGIARLAGVIRGQNLPCTLLDANLEGQLFLLTQPPTAADTWSRRASRNLGANLAALRAPLTYASPGRYQRAVADLNRLLGMAGRGRDLTLGLANYQDERLSPVRSDDLLQAAESPAENIFYPYFAARLPPLLEEERPALLGFSLNYLSQALCTFAMIGFLKRRYPEVAIVVGGGLITSWLHNPAWRNPFAGLIDHLVAGPGEAPLLALLRGGTPTPQAPDYQGLPLGDYIAPGLILPYAASLGCYWNQCSFCPEKAEGNPYLPLAVAGVVADLRQLAGQAKPVLIHLLDNAVSPALMRGLVAEPPGADWYGFARVSPLLADVEFCQALRRSGCVMLKLGLESGDQGVLDAMRKGIDLALVAQALAALRAAGIATYVYLLFGTPAESLAAAHRTLDFVVRHRAGIGFLNLAIFNMPLGSPEAAELAEGGFYEGDLSLYTDFRHPLGWNRRQIRRFLDQDFKRHPTIAAILRRDPPLFTSNHAPFFAAAALRPSAE